jgi:organic radical activating enzyme
MSTWIDFYNQIKGNDWPDCVNESDFELLPINIQQECINEFGYTPGEYRKKSKLTNKVFPINTETACQLKWTWSTIFLTKETTASCHRTDHHQFDADSFDFHNTPEKINDRQQMLLGKWPERGCDYCRNIEQAGGQSDRITNLNFPGIYSPPELDTDPSAVVVTPRILEVYFDNTCNLKCLYCGPHFSSLWDAENIRFGDLKFNKSKNIEKNKQKIFEYLKEKGRHLTVFNILGGEPLYQSELEECLALFDQHPAPELELQIFTNLNTNIKHLTKIVDMVKRLIDQDKLRKFQVTASLDCWGAEQEYVRFPLNLNKWEENFNYLLNQPWINLIVSSTVTPLTIKTLPDLLEKIKTWNKIRKVYHYQNSVNSPSYMFIDIFGDIFSNDFEKSIDLKLANTDEEIASKQYLEGIAKQSASNNPNIQEITKLYNFLNKIDLRRNTNWKKTFPWLIDEFVKYNLI